MPIIFFVGIGGGMCIATAAERNQAHARTRARPAPAGIQMVFLWAVLAVGPGGEEEWCWWTNRRRAQKWARRAMAEFEGYWVTPQIPEVYGHGLGKRR